MPPVHFPILISARFYAGPVGMTNVSAPIFAGLACTYKSLRNVVCGEWGTASAAEFAFAGAGDGLVRFVLKNPKTLYRSNLVPWRGYEAANAPALHHPSTPQSDKLLCRMTTLGRCCCARGAGRWIRSSGDISFVPAALGASVVTRDKQEHMPAQVKIIATRS